MDKTNLILNSTIELVDVQEEGNGKGRPFVSRFLEPGIAHYKELGDILITKETLNKFIHTMVGCPVIIEHEDVTDKNADKLRVGVVSRVWFNEMDGYFYCEGILTDPEAIDLVKNQGYNVSCAYSFVSDNTKRTHNGKEIDMEFIDGEFLHLALVKDPRYEGANIVVNKNDDDLEWITVKGNHIPVKKGQSKDEAVKEFLEGKKETDGEDYKTGDKITFDTNWRGINEKISEGTIIGKEKKLGTKDDPNPDYQYKVKTSDGKTILVEKEAIKPKDKSSESKDEYNDKDKQFEKEKNKLNKQGYDTDNMSDKEIHDLILSKKLTRWGLTYGNPDAPTEKVVDKLIKDFPALQSHRQEIIDKVNEHKKKHYADYDDVAFEILSKKESTKDTKDKPGDNNKANNSIGDITMTVLNDLTDFIKKVVKNEKDEEMKEVKNEDKRKLIDEVGGILKGKVDEEVWRTVVGKLEKVAYEPSEDDKADNKAKNEDEEEKEAKNKCKNEEDKKADDEDDEKEEKVTKNEDEEDKEEDKAENKKVKNSMKDIVMGGSSQVQTQKLYTSRKERLEEGNKY